MRLAVAWCAAGVGAFIGAACGAVVQGLSADVPTDAYFAIAAYALVWGAVAWVVLR